MSRNSYQGHRVLRVVPEMEEQYAALDLLSRRPGLDFWSEVGLVVIPFVAGHKQ